LGQQVDGDNREQTKQQRQADAKPAAEQVTACAVFVQHHPAEEPGNQEKQRHAETVQEVRHLHGPVASPFSKGRRPTSGHEPEQDGVVVNSQQHGGRAHAVQSKESLSRGRFHHGLVLIF
jgi:hypothetical protein